MKFLTEKALGYGDSVLKKNHKIKGAFKVHFKMRVLAIVIVTRNICIGILIGL